MRRGWEGGELSLQQLLELHSLRKPIKMPRTYTRLAGALSFGIPIGRAGCQGDKGGHLCGAGGVWGHKESGQHALPSMPPATQHTAALATSLIPACSPHKPRCAAEVAAPVSPPQLPAVGSYRHSWGRVQYPAGEERPCLAPRSRCWGTNPAQASHLYSRAKTNTTRATHSLLPGSCCGQRDSQSPGTPGTHTHCFSFWYPQAHG